MLMVSFDQMNVLQRDTERWVYVAVWVYTMIFMAKERLV